MAASEQQGEKRSAEEETVLSLLDVLEEDEALQDEACAVLGASDAEKCSYPQGYVKRQALYACNTCTPKTEEPAGVCLACSYKCHEGHELFELYTKRNFRCDCGNGKFKQLECKLHPDKEKSNAQNKYNDNFFGLYCICKRPYPDPEDETPDEMVQCIVCEDWFHGRHLGTLPPEHVDFQEMVCQGCMERCTFLRAYNSKLGVPGVTKITPAETDQEEIKVDFVETAEAPNTPAITTEEVKVETSQPPEVKEEEKPSCTPSASTSSDQKPCNGETSCAVKTEVKANSACKLEEFRKGQGTALSSATYWPSSWRCQLCRCAECMKLYAEHGLLFLLDDHDTVQAYEKKGKSEVQDNKDPLMAALSSMSHVQQVELICEYNDLKTELKDYLKRFADEGKVVQSEDIKKFFEDLRSKKRRRLDNMQYYCS
ncbi:putative E3 ubiquitin-protein ligase UBR7 isoform X2 [Hyperolius riggenbachi]